MLYVPCGRPSRISHITYYVEQIEYILSPAQCVLGALVCLIRAAEAQFVVSDNWWHNFGVIRNTRQFSFKYPNVESAKRAPTDPYATACPLASRSRL